MRRRLIRIIAKVIRRLRSWRRAMSAGLTARASAALSALLAGLLLAWAGSFTVLPHLQSGPADLVEDYLDALRDKDVEAALDIAGARLPSGDQAVFLTEKALSSDWRVDSVQQLTPAIDAGVGVTATIADESGRATRGKFFVSDESGEWRIRNPFVKVTHHGVLPLSYLDLNGVSAALPDPSSDTEAATFPVFPGSYRLYSGQASLLTTAPGHALLLPGESDDSDPQPQGLDTAVSVSDKGVKAAQKAVNAVIDTCADSDEVNPRDCPFAGADDFGEMTGDDRVLGDVEDVEWKVGDYPRIGVTDSDSGVFGLVRHDDATIKLSGTGVDLYGSEKRVKFTVECSYDFGDARATLSASGKFSITFTDNASALSDCQR